MQFKIILLLVVISVVLNTLANILIKKGALQKGNIFINRYTPLGYVLFVIVMLISLKLITIIELKYFSLIMALNYFMTYMAGIVIFKEKTNKWGIIGIIIVCSGIIIFNI